MDCKITSIKRRLSRRSGMSLVEMLVAIAIGAILLMVVASLALFSARSLAGIVNYVDLNQKSRSALDTLTRDIRQVNRLIEYNATQLTFEDADGHPLYFVYNPATKNLRRIKSSGTNTGNAVLLRECQTLNFNIYQRNPKNGTFDQYPTATPATCKLVQVSWVCSRKVLGTARNTESVQTAKIVIRKQ